MTSSEVDAQRPSFGTLEDASVPHADAPSLRGFEAFDARLTACTAPLLEVVVQSSDALASESSLEAAAVHAARRLGDGALLAVHDAGGDVVAALHSALGARRLDHARVVSGSCEPSTRDASSREVGAALADALERSSARKLVVLDRRPGRFSLLVLDALASALARHPQPGDPPSDRAPVVVWVRPASPLSRSSSRRAPESAIVGVALDGVLSAREASAWWRTASRSVDAPNFAPLDSGRPDPGPDAGPAPPDALVSEVHAPALGHQRGGVATLPGLERWLNAVRGTPVPSRGAALARLPDGARALHAVLSAAGRAWPLARLDELDTVLGCDVVGGPGRPGVPEAAHARPPLSALLDVLRGEGIALVAGDSVGALLVEHAQPLDGDRATRLASSLERCFGNDAWALLRAAELSLSAGAVAPARRSIRAALVLRLEPEARGELVERAAHALTTFARRAEAGEVARDAELPEALLELTELAQRYGEFDHAVQLGRLLLSVAPLDARGLLAVGRLDVARGDLATAELTLGRALSSADPTIVCAAKVELAELAYAAGDLGLARERAEDALCELEHRVGPGTARAQEARLAARNVLGKLLLSGAAFAEAEARFVEDTLDAQLGGLVTAELRSRVNRAIAALSLGRRLDARSMLEEVLAEAERADELRAMAMAITNLATIAILEHRHVDALELGERAVEVLRRTGERPRVVRAIANLAELRLWMGLVDEADDAIRFARHSLRTGLSASHAAHLSLVAARVRLLRGDTVGAQRHLSDTLASLGRRELLAPTPIEANPERTLLGSTAERLGSAPSGGSVGKLCAEALRLGARIALADGEVAQASRLLERAAEQANSPRGRAEQLLLEALVARAAGHCRAELVSAALRACTEVDDDELVREALVLASRAARERGALEEASNHLRAASKARDRIVEGLSPALAQRYLARAELVELAALEAAERAGSPASASPLVRELAPEAAKGAAVHATNELGRRREVAPAARGIIGHDPAIRALLGAIRKVGPHDTTVLVHGESGTGKELVAEALHAASPRASGPLVKVNCAALVETLLLSELFGHEKGSFTGAAGRRRGRFEAAEGGTLFLDEIGDISPATQVALLRVLQERSFERVGGTTTIRADVRVVCATHRNLKALVERGQFREDLYYRLCGVVLEVPPLRERLGDLGALADNLLSRIAAERGTELRRVSARALAALRQHSWPGNVRELENALRAASLFAEGEELELEDFTDNVESLRQLGVEAPLEAATSLGPALAPSGAVLVASSSFAHSSEPLTGPVTERTSSPGESRAPSGGALRGAPSAAEPSRAPSTLPPAPASVPDAAYASIRSGTSLHDIKRLIERECVARALGDAGGNITRAASLLGMKRPRLSQLVKQYGLAGSGDGEPGDAEAVESVSDAEED